MPGSTFRTSRAARDRRRLDGPVLTVVRGTPAAPDPGPGASSRPHPAFEGFTPVDRPARPWEPVARESGPEWSVTRTASRDGTSPAGAHGVPSGPGPIVDQLAFVRLIADYLEQTAGTASDADGESTSSLRQTR